MRLRALPASLAVALVVAGSATAGVRISAVDTSGYPEVRLTVVAPVGSGSPVLHENGIPALGLQSANLAGEKSVVLAVDRSESMAGKSLAAAPLAPPALIRPNPSSHPLPQP